MSVDKLLDNMKSKEDFIFFMRCLLNDNQVNIEEWENRDDWNGDMTEEQIAKL